MGVGCGCGGGGGEGGGGRPSVVGCLSRSKRNQLRGSPGAERHISSAFPPGPRDCFHLRSPGATRKNAGLSRPASHEAPVQGARARVTPSCPNTPHPLSSCLAAEEQIKSGFWCKEKEKKRNQTFVCLRRPVFWLFCAFDRERLEAQFQLIFRGGGGG